MSDRENPTVFCAFDLEMNQPSGSIIQVGATIFNVQTRETLDRVSIHIFQPEILNPDIVKLTGITQADVDGGNSLQGAYLALETLWEKHGYFVNPVVWGHGDSEVFRNQLGIDRRAKFIFGFRSIDVKAHYQALRFLQGLPTQGGLAKAMTKVGLNFEGKKHQASDDSYNTARMFMKLLELGGYYEGLKKTA